MVADDHVDREAEPLLDRAREFGGQGLLVAVVGGEHGLPALQVAAYTAMSRSSIRVRRSAMGTFLLPPTLIPRSSAAYVVVMRTP